MNFLLTLPGNGQLRLGCGEDLNYSGLGGERECSERAGGCRAAWQEAGCLVIWSGGQRADQNFIQKSRQGDSLQWEENLTFPLCWNREDSKEKKRF